MNNIKAIPLNYSYIFTFEEQFDHQQTRNWMIKYWTSGFVFCGLYVLFIFSMQYYMKNRPRFEIRRVLVLWNIMLAAFSLMGASRTAPEFYNALKNHGFYYSVCVPSFIEDDPVSGFWTWMFVLSKLPELGDTVFIVLRKQPLIFLHWYHHVTVLLYSWFSYTEYTASARWFIVMNYFVHSIMYTYYALRAMGYMLPRQFAMLITSCQLMQMVIGCIVNIWGYEYLSEGQDCHISYVNIKLSIAMYFSYFILFVRFFYTSYFHKSKKPKCDGSKAKSA